jgi:hypothetical protein
MNRSNKDKNMKKPFCKNIERKLLKNENPKKKKHITNFITKYKNK